MNEIAQRFDDGAAYERMMGTWSRLAGAIFLDWLALLPGLRCIDVGCGNGSFTELVVDRCAPAKVVGIDPSHAQLDFARLRPAARVADFEYGSALALPFADGAFDAATMALVIAFVPDPGKAVAEMARVVSPGGIVAAYMWDLLGEGSPIEPVDRELRALNLPSSRTPNPEASRMDTLRSLWTAAGLDAVETREIVVQRSFADFDEFWAVIVPGTLLKQALAAMDAADVKRLVERVRANLPADATGRITYRARANAVRGRVA